MHVAGMCSEALQWKGRQMTLLWTDVAAFGTSNDKRSLHSDIVWLKFLQAQTQFLLCKCTQMGKEITRTQKKKNYLESRTVYNEIVSEICMDFED
jgi:hypothetical protein